MSPQVTDFRLTNSDADNLTMGHPWSRHSSNIATYLMVDLLVSLIIVSTYPKGSWPSISIWRPSKFYVELLLHSTMHYLACAGTTFSLPYRQIPAQSCNYHVTNHGARLSIFVSVSWVCDRLLGRFQLYKMSQFSCVIATSVSYIAIIEKLYYSLRKLFLSNPAKITDFLHGV